MRRAGLLLAAALLAVTGRASAQVRPDTGLRGILANGYRFAYVESGHGIPLVLVHGALTDFRFWAGQLGTLGDTARVIAYSRRHHYPNPWRPDDSPIGFESSAWDLAAIVRALQLDRPVLVGHSWGGLVALQAALRQPALFRAVILVEPIADSLIADPALRAATSRRAGEAMDLALARFSPRDPAPALTLWLDTLYGEGFWGSLGADGQARLRDNAHTLPSAGAPQPPVSCADLAHLTLPVLLVGGSKSGARQQATLETLAGCLPSATRLVVTGAGPLLPRTHPREFAEVVRRFLAALPRP